MSVGYQIIAGERRWRAYQFAGLKEIPAIIREPEPDDIEARELSLIENWHRVNLDSKEAEDFIYKLWKDGKKAGKYKSIADMARKLGIPQPTLQPIIKAHEDRQKLGIGPNITTYDLVETRVLDDMPEIRKEVIRLRQEEKITQREIREFRKIIKEHPELAEYTIKLKEKGKDVDEIRKAVEFVATQPEPIKKEFVEAGIDIESVPVHHISVEIPEEKLTNYCLRYPPVFKNSAYVWYMEQNSLSTKHGLACIPSSKDINQKRAGGRDNGTYSYEYNLI